MARRRPERDAVALARCLRAMRDAGLGVPTIARGLGFAHSTIERWCHDLKVPASTCKPREQVEPLDGEEWRDRDDLGLRVSSMGRVASLSTGTLLKATTRAAGYGEAYITTKGERGREDSRHNRKGRRTIVVSRLVAETFDLPWEPRSSARNIWTDAELETLRKCRTLEQARRVLPGRTDIAIQDKAKLIKHRLKVTRKAKAPPVQVVRGSVPVMQPLWAEADALVSRNLAQDVREDLVSEIVVMMLAGEQTDMRSALKEAVRERHRIMGTYRERSLDAPLPGTESLCLIDTLAADVEHF